MGSIARSPALLYRIVLRGISFEMRLLSLIISTISSIGSSEEKRLVGVGLGCEVDDIQ
jgi:hypothetical protein